jgi:ectoine hydroxylase
MEGVEIPAERYLLGRLSRAERAQFATEGWLLVPNALDAADADELEALMDAMREAKLREGRHRSEIIAQAPFSETNDIQNQDVVDRLITSTAVFPKVVDILGANIRVYHSHFNYTPPRSTAENGDAGEPEPSDYSQAKTLGFHQDSHRLNVELGHRQPGGPRPRISLKCAFFLSDCSRPGRGNTWIVPGQHLSDTLPPPCSSSGTSQPPGAMPVLAPRRSCLIFDRRLWVSAHHQFMAAPP